MVKDVFCLMGPTASGKTALACELAARYPLEIISVDSALIYREMNIGTAKPDLNTLKQFPHHLIDILNPPESYSVATFCEDATRLCHAIQERGKIPLLVGGTMMYFRALQGGITTLPSADTVIRDRIIAKANIHGWGAMHSLLAKVDPPSAIKIHPNDTQRIQRALEVYELTGKPLSASFTDSPISSFHFHSLLLVPEDRKWLHERIETRFEEMLALGLVQEVEALIQKWPLTPNHPSMRAVGYRQAFQYLKREINKEALLPKGVAATRQLAKRQLTWLRQWPNPNNFIAEDPKTLTKVMAFVQQLLDNH